MTSVSTDSIIEGEVKPPEILISLFQTLYGGESNITERISRQAESSAADAVFCASNGKMIPGKHLTLGTSVKSLTGSNKMCPF